MKILSGSILSGLSLMAEVLNEWFSHFFFSAYHLARGMSLQGGGSFSAPLEYRIGNIEAYGVDIFLGTRVLIWAFMALGIALIVWGLRDRSQSPEAKSE